ncbi:MAG: glutathione S-transferase family protein [Betaproteobacteria bacterium]|jgi:glutathione S-transferase|nr:glutathione S-transferase family protein [Betaproteobacteria bacterium]
MILHHYPTSPFAEKIRLIFGYKHMEWQGVEIPMVMPKPDLMPLTGGYRKTPVLQIGADIYCDTALICDVLEQMVPTPSLYHAAPKGLVRTVAQWADNVLFPVAMAYNFQPAGAQHVMASMPADVVKVFAEDRKAMRGGGARMPAPDATAMYKSHLRRLSTMLEDHAFLLGDTPCLADFSVYHSVWFTIVKVPVIDHILDATPLVREWAHRMASIGHGKSQAITAAQALHIAAAAKPVPLHDDVFQDEHGIPLGTQVSVAADSFGTEPTTGTLVAATRTRLTLERNDPQVGQLHVHFPRMGFIMKKADA